MAKLEISLLGKMEFCLDGQPVSGFAYHKARALVAYLAVEARRPHPREALAELLWPDLTPEAARVNLRQVLADLRKVFRPGETPETDFFTITRETVQLNPQSAYALDVDRFQALIARCSRHAHRALSRCPACAHRLAEAADLYHGDFLTPMPPVDSALYEEWAVLKRETLHQQAAEAIAALALHAELWGNRAEACRLHGRSIELEPWNETAYQHLMTLLAAEGQRSAALAAYEACRRALAQELGIQPLPETERLFQQIKTGDLPQTSAPPLRAFPAVPTPLVGREAELERLADLLGDPANRLITVIGPGGVGKTRLALAAAAANGPMFGDGTAYVSLAGLDAPPLLASAILSALEIVADPATEPERQLIALLRTREMLLVLDNYEQLLPEIGLVKSLISQAPRAVLLVSSRERLALQAERVFELEGLGVPPEKDPGPLERYDAVMLFVERAQRIRPRFALTAPEAPWVAQLCRLVEGMPLALELAASTLHLQTCEALVQRLAGDLHVLESTYRDLPERHRTLLAAFEESWRLLAEAEQRAFRRLSVFRGGFDEAAAASVAGAVAGSLAALADKSLVRRGPAGRYDMHELLRQFGGDKLQEAQAAEMAGDAHLAYFLELAEQADPHLGGADQQAWLDRLNCEHENLRAAIAWANRSGQADVAVRLVGVLALFWIMRGAFAEGQYWVEQTLAVSSAASPAAREKLLARAGILAFRRSDFATAVARLTESLALARALNDLDKITRRLQTLAVFATRQGDYEQARHWVDESLAIDRSQNNLDGIAYDLGTLGDIAYWQGDYLRARQHWTESLKLHRQRQEPNSIAVCLQNLGEVARFLGEPRQALAPTEEAERLFREMGNQQFLAMTLSNLALIRLDLNELPAAIPLFREALDLLQPLGDNAELAALFENIARLPLGCGDLADSVQLFAAGAALHKAVGDAVTPHHSEYVVACLSSTREHMGETAFQAAWERGYRGTIGQAIDLARRTLVR